MIPAHVVFVPSGVEIAVAPGTTLHVAALEAGVPVDVPCGGAGLCRGCRVVAHGELSPPDRHEIVELSADELDRGVRLACIARVEGEATVDTRRSATRSVSVVEAFRGDAGRAGTAAEGDDFVIGIDVGTTTLVAALADADTGDERGTAAAVNPQVEFGADVMSRIGRAVTDGEAMRRAVVAALEGLVAKLRVESSARGLPERVAVAGNTTMLHILSGEDPSSVGVAPYEPVFLESRRLEPELLGLDEGVTVETLPGSSAFIGADVIAGVMATRLIERDGTCVFLDIGTNGEVVLKTASGDLYAASAAAGPAFEGGGIECGARAVPGAIEHVWHEGGELRYSTIDDAEPVGICGTGLIDLVATLLRLGIVDKSGRLVDGGSVARRECCGGDAVAVAEDVWLSQGDVRALQLAMGAISTALEMLLERAGVGPDAVEEVLIAGGFGYRLDAGSLADVGIIPRSWVERTVFVGNASKAGAVRWAASDEARQEAADIASSLEVVELSREATFQDRFVANLGFPR